MSLTYHMFKQVGPAAVRTGKIEVDDAPFVEAITGAQVTLRAQYAARSLLAGHTHLRKGRIKLKMIVENPCGTPRSVIPK